MAFPTRLNSALKGLARLPVSFVFDASDANPITYIVDDGSGQSVGILLNGAALFDANGKLVDSNVLAGSVTTNTLNALRVGKWTYSFAVNGGASGTIPMTGLALPANAVVVGGVMDVTTIVAGAGATAAIQLESANDIISAAALSGAPWSTTGLKAIVPVFTNATYKKTTVGTRVPSLIVTAANLTAGVFNLQLVYMVDDA